MTWDQGKERTGTSWWKTKRARILRRDQHRCTWTDDGNRCIAPATDVDHIDNEGAAEAPEGHPIHRDDNLRSLCPRHHRAKTAAEGVLARQATPRKRKPEPHPGLRTTSKGGG